MVVVGAWVAAMAYLVYSYHATSGGFVGCPFRAVTGYSCFGCGMTRASACFLHGDFLTSLTYHPLGGVFVVGFTLYAARRAADLLAGHAVSFPGLALWQKHGDTFWVAIAVFLVVFGGLRLILELAGILTPV